MASKKEKENKEKDDKVLSSKHFFTKQISQCSYLRTYLLHYNLSIPACENQ